MKKIISAALFFMISVLLCWFTIDAAEIPAYESVAGSQPAHCFVPFTLHNPDFRLNSIFNDSTPAYIFDTLQRR